MNLLGGDDVAAGLPGLGGGSGSGRAANSSSVTSHNSSQDATGSGALFCLYVNIGCNVLSTYLFLFYLHNIVKMTYTKLMDVVINIVNVLDIILRCQCVK